jgi:hypothetical protein
MPMVVAMLMTVAAMIAVSLECAVASVALFGYAVLIVRYLAGAAVGS